MHNVPKHENDKDACAVGVGFTNPDEGMCCYVLIYSQIFVFGQHTRLYRHVRNHCDRWPVTAVHKNGGRPLVFFYMPATKCHFFSSFHPTARVFYLSSLTAISTIIGSLATGTSNMSFHGITLAETIWRRA